MSRIFFPTGILTLLGVFVALKINLLLGAVISVIGATVAVINLIVYLRKRKTN